MSIISWAVIAWKCNILMKESRLLSCIIQRVSSNKRIGDLKESFGDTQAEKVISATMFQASQRITKCVVLSEISDVERIVKESSITSLYNYKSNLEKFNSSLATIANIAPYIGLLGTVWGLLDAFQNIGNVKVVTFQTVAPSIVEALFATAIGLAVAIPASAGHNIITRRTQCITNKLIMINDSLVNQISTYKAGMILDNSKRG